MPAPVQIFIAYSHLDLRYKDELKKFLRPLLITGQAELWDDYDIEAGQDWEAEIKKRLYGADLILLLVSPDSLASDYFYGREVAVSLERHERGEAMVVPVVLRPCMWSMTPIGKLEALPTKAIPVTSWASQDEAFNDIAHRVSAIVEARQVKKRQESEMETQRRDFMAGAEAAANLFDSGRFEEARRAYTDLRKYARTGWEPNAATIEERISQCATQIKALKPKPVRVPSPKPLPQDQPTSSESTVRVPIPQKTNFLVPILIVAALLAALAIYWFTTRPNNNPERHFNNKPDTVQELQRPKQTPSKPMESLEFARVKNGTIPELQAFVARTDISETDKTEATKLLNKQIKTFEDLLKNARAFDNDAKEACPFVQQAYQLWPTDARVRQLAKKLHCLLPINRK